MILLLLKEWLLKRQSLFYIGRHDVLKAPLKGKEEKEALLKLQNGDEHAKDLLIEHNLRLVVYVAKKYDSMQNGNIEDLISIGTIEEKIIALQEKKKALSDMMIEGEQRSEMVLSKLSSDELLNLFR